MRPGSEVLLSESPLLLLQCYRRIPLQSPKTFAHLFKICTFFFKGWFPMVGRGNARKCPINHLSVLTQLKSRKCKETTRYLSHCFAYNKKYQKRQRPLRVILIQQSCLSWCVGSKEWACQSIPSSPSFFQGQPLGGLFWIVYSVSNHLETPCVQHCSHLCKSRGFLILTSHFKREFTSS